MKEAWDKLPKELKVTLYIGVSGFLAEIIKYLQITNADSALLMAIINVFIVMLQVRIPQLKTALEK